MAAVPHHWPRIVARGRWDTDQRRNLGRNREAQASRSRLAARLDLAAKSFNTGRVWLRFPF